MASSVQYQLSDDEKDLMKSANMEDEICMVTRKLNSRITKRENNWTTCTSTDRLSEQMSILLFGMGGVGKSALGSVLVGEANTFRCANTATTETTRVRRVSGDYKGESIVVYDTPGYMAREAMKGEVDPKKAMKEGLHTIKDGVHILALVFNAGSMRSLDSEIQLIQKANLLNNNTFRHCVLVVTHSATSYAMKSVDDFIKDAQTSPAFTTLLENIGYRVILVELGSGDPVTEKNIDYSPFYSAETEASRDMLINMMRSVYIANTSTGSLYKKEEMQRDLVVCFPPLANISTPNGKKTMEDLELNDEVLVVTSQGQLLYEKVIMFSHANPSHRSYFCTLSTEDGKVLQLSPGHLLHVGHVGKLTAAQDVKVGDVVFTCDAAEGVSVKPAQVTAISGEWLTGIYCPHTPSGSILVDGVAASCYTNLLSPTLAHAVMLPVRVAHRLLPDDWFRWMLPYNQEQGMPSLALKVSRMMRWS